QANATATARAYAARAAGRERNINPPEAFGGPTSVTRDLRAVASKLCDAVFRRVCLCRASQEDGDPAELSPRRQGTSMRRRHPSTGKWKQSGKGADGLVSPRLLWIGRLQGSVR